MEDTPSSVARQTRVVLQVLLVISGVAFGLWALHRLAPVVLVLVVAAWLAYVLAPLVHFAQRPIRWAGRPRHLPRGAAIALVYVLLAGSVSAGAALLLPSATEQVNDMITRAPMYGQSIATWQHDWSGYYARVRIPLDLRQGIDRSVLEAGDAAVEAFGDRCWRWWALSSRICHGSS